MRAEPFGALPACSRSVCVLAQSAASGRCSSSSTTTTTGQSVSRLPVRGHGQRNALPAGLSDGKSPLPRPRALLVPCSGSGSAGMAARSRAVHGSVPLLSPRPRRRRSRACVSVPRTAERPVAVSVGSFTGDSPVSDSYWINAILCASGTAGRTVRHLTKTQVSPQKHRHPLNTGPINVHGAHTPSVTDTTHWAARSRSGSRFICSLVFG